MAGGNRGLYTAAVFMAALPGGWVADRLIGAYNHDLTVPEFSMGYEWDIVVDGPDATWFEPEGEH